MPKIFITQKCLLIEFPKNTVHFSAVNGRALSVGGLHLPELEEKAPTSSASGFRREHVSAGAQDGLLHGPSAALPAAWPFPLRCQQGLCQWECLYYYLLSLHTIPHD